MNYKRMAKTIESFLNYEIKCNVPLAIISPTLIAYKNYAIKKVNNHWVLCHPNGDSICNFKYKVTAILAAKYMTVAAFDDFANMKILDSQCWNSKLDTQHFLNRYATTKDDFKRSVYLARWQLTSQRERYYKKKLSDLFKTEF